MCKNSVHLQKGQQFCHQINDCSLQWAGSLYFSYRAQSCETEACMENEGPDFFFLTEMSSYVTMPGRRRPPARCDKPQALSTHCSENAVGGLPRLMELMTVIALGNLSFSLLCTFSPCGALYTYHQAHIWNATTLSVLIQIGRILL